MNAKTKELLSKIINICLYLGLFAILIVCISEKTNLHCDEVYTYVMSNNTSSDAITVAPKWYYLYENPEQVWLDTMTVQKGELFNFENVWAKQAADNHPPFYYVLIHIISSLFPTVYSKWFAGIVNIIFGLLTLFVGRKIVKNLTNNRIPLFLASCCLIFSAGILSAMTFFRMYAAAMFFVTLISYLFLKGIEKRNFSFYISLFIVSVLGALTHYYFVIYLFFICFTFGIILLLKKQWKDCLTLVGTMILAGCSAIAIFPAMLKHVFGNSLRGQQTMSQLVSNTWEAWIEKFKMCYAIVDSQLFGGTFFFLIIIGFLAILIGWVLKRKKQTENETNVNPLNRRMLIEKWLLLWIPVVSYFIFVSKIVVFITDRYFHLVYALLIILVVTMVSIAICKILKPQIAFILLLVVFLFSTFKEFGNNWFYLYRSEQSFLNTAASHADKDCVYIFNLVYEIDPSFYEIRNYDRVVFVPYTDMDGITEVLLNTKNGVIVSVAAGCSIETVHTKIQEKWPDLDVCEYLGRHSFSTTYYIH